MRLSLQWEDLQMGGKVLHQLDRKKSDAFEMWFWGRILHVLWPVDYTNTRANYTIMVKRSIFAKQ